MSENKSVAEDIRNKLSPQVVQLLDQTALRLRGESLARWYWEQLSRDQRRELGRSFDKALRKHGGAIWLHSAVEGVPVALSILELGERCDHISSASKRECLQELAKFDLAIRQAIQRSTHVEDEEVRDRVVQSVAAHKIVVIRGTIHLLYFNGRRVNVAWNRCPKSWDFMVMLAVATKRNGVVDFNDLGGERSLLSSRKKNLLRALKRAPIDQNVRDAITGSIAHDRNRQGYHLAFDRSEVDVIDTGLAPVDANLPE